MGDLHIDLLNGSNGHQPCSRIPFMHPVWHLPSYLLANSTKPTIINPKGHTIATIPHSEGLYCVIIPNETQTSHHANAATGKMDINKAHRKLSHISPVAIKHAISKGYITGTELANKSKPDFCKACVKAKLLRQPFPKESKTCAKNMVITYTETYGDQQE